MRLIVISDFEKCNDPIQIEKMFELGLFRFHIKENINETKAFLKKIDSKFLPQISFHGNAEGLNCHEHGKNLKSSKSESCHEVNEAITSNKKYCFLSPIYNSISKVDYLSTFDFKELKRKLEEPRDSSVFALGGIAEDNVLEVRDMGFDGAALKGFVWNVGVDPVGQFKKIVARLNK